MFFLTVAIERLYRRREPRDVAS